MRNFKTLFFNTFYDIDKTLDKKANGLYRDPIKSILLDIYEYEFILSNFTYKLRGRDEITSTEHRFNPYAQNW